MIKEFCLGLEMRSHLKRAKRSREVVELLYQGGGYDAVRVLSVGWFTMRVDVYDDDETTWVARQIVAVSDVYSLNEKSTARARRKLMAGAERILSGPEGCGHTHGRDHDEDEDEDEGFEYFDPS